MAWLSRDELVRFIMSGVPDHNMLCPNRLEALVATYPRRLVGRMADPDTVVFGLYPDEYEYKPEYEYFVTSAGQEASRSSAAVTLAGDTVDRAWCASMLCGCFAWMHTNKSTPTPNNGKHQPHH